MRTVSSLLFALVVVGCEGAEEVAPLPDAIADSTVVDAAPDAVDSSSDTSVDSTLDASPETPLDSSADSSVDSTPDSIADAAADDAATDGETEGGVAPPGPPHACSKRFGDALGQVAWGVATDAAGNVVIAGGFFGTVDFGGGPMTSSGGFDAFVAKFDSKCKHLWSKRHGDADDQRFTDVAIDASGNVVLVGTFAGTSNLGGSDLVIGSSTSIVVAKLSSSGAHLWSRNAARSASAYAISDGLAVGPTGSIAIAGYFGAGTLDFASGVVDSGAPLSGHGAQEGFVAVLDDTGKHLWSRSFGAAADNAHGRGVAFDGVGNLTLVGRLGAGGDPGGGTLAAGGFVASYSSSGTHRWSRSFPGTWALADVAVNAANDVYVSGEITTSADFGGGTLTATGIQDVFVASFDATGAHRWSRSFGSNAVQSSSGLAIDASGNVVLSVVGGGSVDFGTGAFTTTVTDPDIFLVLLDGAGITQWARRFGDTTSQEVARVAVGPGNAIVLAGGGVGTVDFGGGPLVSAGQEDAFLVRFAP